MHADVNIINTQESLAVLSRHAEFVATFLNEDEEPEPRLGQCCMQERVCDNDCFYGGTCDGGSDKQETSDLGREDQQSMRPLWCIQEQEQVMKCAALCYTCCSQCVC